MSPTRSRYSRCRYCPALIVWAETSRGKRMPVDIARNPDGNVRLVWRRAYDEPLAMVLGPRALAEARVEHQIAYEQGLTDEPVLALYTSHWVTCPNAERARRAKARSAA